jgi:hypothetical protein
LSDDSGHVRRSSKVRFGDYAQQWLDSRKLAHEIESSTLERSRGIIRDHLLPHLAAIPLAKISVAADRVCRAG